MTRLFLVLLLAVVPLMSLAQDRIGVRVVDGEGEFYNTVTGATFRPRGVNYLRFRPAGGHLEDRVLGVGGFDVAEITRDFNLLRSEGYDTVRIFFDHCSNGQGCIVTRGKTGLNPDYMDNLATLTRIAAQTGIYLLLTSNDIPDDGGYGEMANRDASERVSGYRNAHFMTAGGVVAFEAYWRDIMAALKARDTAWPAVLGWSILNEQWIFKDQPPWSLTSGTFVNGTGQSYDLSDPAQKRAALADNLVLIVERVRAVVRAADPEALVTMGFFAPQFPNATTIGGDWFVDTEPLLARAPLDFFDFHAYVDWDLPIGKIAENYGLPRHRDRPVIMGEVGSSPAFIPRAETALRKEQEWIAASCRLGWDGWLHWGFAPFPPGIDPNPPYTLTGDDGLFLGGLSPKRRPDPCLDGDYEPHVNLAFDATARASRSLPGRGPENALDGLEIGWESGTDAPGWIEILLATPSTVSSVDLWLAQWPAGTTRTRVTARLADGSRVLLGDRRAETQEGQHLVFSLPGGLGDVASLKAEILESPSWVALHDVEILRQREDPAACLATAPKSVNLRADPSTDNRPVGQLGGGWSVIVDGITPPDGAGHAWYRTAEGAFVRDDVVSLAGPSKALAPVPPN